jgi:transposase
MNLYNLCILKYCLLFFFLTKMPNLHILTKEKIYHLYKGTKGTKLSITRISKKLRVSINTVKRVIEDYEKSKHFEPKRKPGAPRITTKKQDQKIITLTENPDIFTSKDISINLQK